MLIQAGPQDGVAAPADPAVSTPIVPTPPTMVSVAAAASTLLLKDMNIPFLEPQPYPAHGCCCCHRGSGLQPAAMTLIRTGTADLIGNAVLKRGKTRANPETHGYSRN